MEKITFGALPLTGTNLKRVMPIRSVQWRSLTDNNVSFYWFLTLFPFDAIGQIGVKFLWFVSYIAQNHRNYIHLSSINWKQHILFGNLVPGQGSSLQERVSSLSPGHEFPPNCGGGLVQVLDLSCTPPPHVTGQSLQSSQSDQFPSTVKMWIGSIWP